MSSFLRNAECFAKQLNGFKSLRFLDSEIMFSHIHISVTNDALNGLKVNTQRLHALLRFFPQSHEKKYYVI